MFFRETTINNPGPAQNVVQMVKADSKRVFLALAINGNTLSSVTTQRNGTNTSGVQLGTNNPVLWMPLREWGLIVQTDWFCINGGGLGVDCTAWEVFADHGAELTAQDFGASPLQRIPAGLRFGEMPDFKIAAPVRDYYAELRDRVKGAIWRATKAQNGAGKSWGERSS